MQLPHHLKKIILLLTGIALRINFIFAQAGDSAVTKLPVKVSSIQQVNWQLPLSKNQAQWRTYIIPATLFLYGVGAIKNDELREINVAFNDEVYAEKPHNKIHIDNYLQYAPAAAVYGLNVLGIKGRHNFRDRSMIFLLSNVITSTTVFSVKKISHQLRPDGSAYNSFPSGHTAEAFASAEFMRQEYKDISPWYAVAGYAMAATTGYLRMYNNKHWFSDVVAGAGVGIASTKLAYWLYPKIQHALFKDKPVHTSILPTYQSGSFGVGLVHQF